ncbi:phage neck terminator protein [Achromobacter sp. PAB15]|uniref:phage neck terminator protein n=1 Tax=Achromobacter sp. PAB15 TaxID=3233048 RepID=UPI003F919199
MAPENAIYELLLAAAGDIPIIFAEENGDRPPRPFITMVLRWAQASPSEVGAVDCEGMQTVHGHRDATVELQSFGNAAYDALDQLVLTLQHTVHEERAEILGLALYDVGRLQNIPINRDGVRYERRGVLELGIRYTRQYAEFVGVIEHVTGTGNTQGELVPGIESPFSIKVVTP